MTDNKRFSLVFCVMFIIFFLVNSVQAADDEALGRTAESEGKLRTALTH